MNSIYNLIKNFIFLFFFDINLDEIETNTNDQTNLENKKSFTNTNITFSHLKLILISSLSLISLIILIKFCNYDTNTNIEQLQNLLNELATTVDWNLYRDIFLNIQKLISSTTDKSIIIYALKEIHSFFLLNTYQVSDPEKFDKIMKEIIALLSEK